MSEFYLSDQDIRDLVESPKEIVRRKPESGFKNIHKSLRCDLELYSSMEEDAFKIFARQSTVIPEDFAIGLRYRIEGLGTALLVRYNGAHGEVSKNEDGHYSVPHIHRMTAKQIASGGILRMPKEREITTKYETFEDAFIIFFKEIGIDDYLTYFPDLKPGLV